MRLSGIPWVAAAWLAAAGSAGLAASAPPPVCPASIVPPETTQAPEGWRAWRVNEAREFRLSDLTFSDGPPQERVFLNSVAFHVKHGKREEMYDFTSASVRQIWMICQYAGTDVALVRETDLRGRRCRLTYPGKQAHQGLAPTLSCE
jgi:hypothetical protein